MADLKAWGGRLAFSRLGSQVDKGGEGGGGVHRDLSSTEIILDTAIKKNWSVSKIHISVVNVTNLFFSKKKKLQKQT